MEVKFTLWLLTLIVGTLAWIYGNSKSEIDYQRHPQLIDLATGIKMRPRDLLEFTKLINKPEKYINSTNAQQRLYDLEYYSNFENPFLLDHSYSREQDLILSGYPVANETLCGQHLHWVLSQLNAHKNYTFLKGRLGYELTSLMDSFGRPESGFYSGVVNWLGSYEQCIKLSLNRGNIKTRYCIGRMRPKWWPANETILPKTTIRMGLCLPESCDTLSFNSYNSTIETLAKFEFPEIFKDGLNMVSMFCLPDERSPIRKIPLAGYIYLYIVGAWCLLVLGATLALELIFNKNKRMAEQPKVVAKSLDRMITGQIEPRATEMTTCEKILEAVSLKSSMKAFKTNTFRVIYARGERVRVDLGGLDFCKVFMAIFIVLGHSGYLALIYSRSLSNRLEMGTSSIGRLGLSVARCVDTFFVFFGTLTSYNLMRKFSLEKLANPLIWLAVNLGIFLRIAPVFMLVYWYARSVSPYTGSGPWWDYGVDKYSMKGVCMSDAWWKSIPYFGSVGTPPVPSCLLPGWFIVSYSQLSLLLPLITYIICKLSSPIKRSLLIGFLSLASALSVGHRLYAQTSVSEEGFTVYGSFLTDLLDKFESSGYLTTLSRLGSTSMGCLVGYLLRQYELGVIREWPNWMQRKLTPFMAAISILMIVFLPLIGHYHYLVTGRMIQLEEFVVANVILTIIWTILNAIIILTATTRFNHTVLARFSSHSFWHAFNKLGLGIFLVHWEILFIGMTNFEQAPTYGSITDIIKMWASGVLQSIVIAFLIHLFIEAPLARLLKILVEYLTKSDGSAEANLHEEVCDKN